MDDFYVNPFSEEFDKEDVVNPKTNKSDSNNDEQHTIYSKNELIEKAILEFDLDSLENFDENDVNQKKFKNLSDDKSLKRIDLFDDKIRQDKYFKDFNSDIDEDSMTDQEILRRQFRDFLLLRKISGVLNGYPHSHRIPEEKVHETGKSIIVEDDSEISELDENKHSSSVFFHRNEMEEIEYIEVICSCGQKTVVKFDYDNSSYTMRPDAFIEEDSGKDLDFNAYEIGKED